MNRLLDRVIRLAAVGLWSALMAGCASVVSSGSSTVSSLDLDTPRFLDEQAAFRLVDRNGLPLATARPQAGRLRFPLPADREVGACVAVLDAAGKSVMAGAKPVALVLRSQYETLSRERETLEAERIGAAAVERTSRDAVDVARARLASSRAFVDGGCQRPGPRPVPPRPTVACASPDACLGDAAAVCFIRYFGDQGCAQARAALKRPGQPSMQACAAAARSAGNGDLEAATLNAVNQAAVQAARALRDSPEPFGRALGNLVAGAGDSIRSEAAMTCAQRLADARYAPLAAWLAESARMQAEPEAALETCRRDLGGIDAAQQEAAGAALRAQQAQARISAIDDRLAALRERRQPLEWCEPPFAADSDRR